MNSSDYQDKINSLLEENNTYKKITDRRRNPTSTTEKSINQLLKEIKNERSLYHPSRFQLNDNLYYRLRSTDAIPAKFYGLPKIHKENNPLRPITSSIGCPTYELSKFLVKVLSPLQDHTHSIKNSVDFIHKITTHKIQPDEILVSFDVISLFTSIPTSLALDVVSNKLTSDTTLHRRTDISPENLIRLLKFVLNNNFFVYQGVHYQQVFGCPMGSPISALLANLVMEHIENKAINTAQHPPKWWFRYVDDVHAGIAHADLNDFHNHLNSINQHIQFTREEENDGSIAFLDTRTTRNEDGSITADVYRKDTHTNKYLDFKSHHPNQHKRTVVKTLLDRAKTIPTTKSAKDTEIKYVESILRSNDYPNHFIKSCSQPKKSNRTNDNANDKGFVVLPYFQGTSEKIAGVLRRQHIKVAFKPVKTIGSILRKPKDKVPTEDSTGIVYEIPCKQCDKIYIGQTARALKTRVKEHKRAITKDDKLSLIAAHHRETNHDFDFDNTKIIDRAANWDQRTFLEAWHSINKPNSINEHINIPQVYRLFQSLS